RPSACCASTCECSWLDLIDADPASCDFPLANEKREQVSPGRAVDQLPNTKTQVHHFERIGKRHLHCLEVHFFVRVQVYGAQSYCNQPLSVCERGKDVEALRKRWELVDRHARKNTEQVRLLRPLLEDDLVTKHEADGA